MGTQKQINTRKVFKSRLLHTSLIKSFLFCAIRCYRNICVSIADGYLKEFSLSVFERKDSVIVFVFLDVTILSFVLRRLEPAVKNKIYPSLQS